MDKNKILKLYQKGMTTREVAACLGIGSTTVGTIVKAAGISRPRTIRKHVLQARAKKCNAFDDNFQKFIDGLLLSDGSIPKPNGVSNASFYCQYSVCLEWLELIKQKFDEHGIKCNIRKAKRKNKIDLGYNFVTWRYDEFLRIRNRWYIDGIKRVPIDIDVNDRNMLKNWIYGDGTLSRKNLRFCTDSFQLEDIEFLINKLNAISEFKFKKINFGFDKQGNQKYRISICERDGARKFFEYVGDCDIDYFKYKWWAK